MTIAPAQLKNVLRLAALLLWGSGGLASASAQTLRHSPQAGAAGGDVHIDSMRFVDAARHRPIPVVTYAPAASVAGTAPKRLKVAVLNHGYGIKNTGYSFLARNLVAHGYYVVSIQHDLPGDPPSPLGEFLAVVRRPVWEQGVQSMVYVLGQLRQAHPEFDFSRTLLVGHSNGGDMVMVFAQEHPQLAWRVITLDNRRMPLPLQRRPLLLSIRSSDQRADEGVLPTLVEQTKYKMEITPLSNTRHNDMWDGATEAQKREMNNLISRFIEKY